VDINQIAPKKKQDVRESPADRLGILYASSFLMIAILSAFAQFFILRELASQSSRANSVVQHLHDGSLECPISFAAMSVVVEQDPEKRRVLLEQLKSVIDQRRTSINQTQTVVAPPNQKNAPSAPPSNLVAHASLEPDKAIQSADRLLELLRQPGSNPSRTAIIDPLIQTILQQERAAAATVSNALRDAELGSLENFNRLERFELEVFVLVVVVLILEGLFVVNPALRKIRSFMREMKRSNEELQSYAQRLERSNKELQDFASVASHDLQEPLRKIQAFSDRLRSRAIDSLEPQARDYLDRIQNAASRMQTLINDLLTYARVATKGQPFIPTDLCTVTNEVISDLEVRIEQVQGKVEIGPLPRLDADPLQLRQLMQNLIGNALKYKRPDVPPIVKVSEIQPTILSAASPDATPREFCQIVVQDNGIGFDQIYAEKIFTIFQRLHGRTEYEGTGVGLAVCRKIVERHGGTITATGTPGQGSTFTVTLPIRHITENNSDVSAA
jgi:signal transduction histidine kinase